MNVDKMIAYYTKVIDSNRKLYGDDWRTLKYLADLERIIELSQKDTLTDEEYLFMCCRWDMTQVFGK